MHAISEKLSKEKIKIHASSPTIFYFFYFFMLKENKTEKQQRHAIRKRINT
jgi:preprotein translocase subunit YajC